MTQFRLQFVMALPTNGRVIIETTAGEIDIELWSKVPNSFPSIPEDHELKSRLRKHPKHVETF